MKTLTQICEDFKISKSTKLEKTKVLAIHRNTFIKTDFEEQMFVCNNHMTLIIYKKDENSIIAMGVNTEKHNKPGWKNTEDIDKSIGIKHEWEQLNDYEYEAPNIDFENTYEVYSTIFEEHEIDKLKNSDDITFYYHNDHSKGTLNYYINDFAYNKYIEIHENTNANI